MKPTDILMEEHRVIEQVLSCRERIAERCVSEGKIDEQPARDAVDFFRAFADRCHHGKEEVHFFPMMEAKGFPREGGPTGQMLIEHEQGRSHVRGMDEAIDRASAGGAAAVQSFAEHARGYIDLLREHIQKEDHCLFTMANKAFGEEEQKSLMTVFEKVESEEMGKGTHEKYLKIANDLADRYGIERAKVHGAGCCGP